MPIRSATVKSLTSMRARLLPSPSEVTWADSGVQVNPLCELWLVSDVRVSANSTRLSSLTSKAQPHWSSTEGRRRSAALRRVREITASTARLFDSLLI